MAFAQTPLVTDDQPAELATADQAEPVEAASEEETIEKVKLTKRETDVLLHLSKGLNYNEIAENLFISSGTIRKHIENIYRKLQVHNKMEAVQKAKSQKLI